ncbi:MAG: phosphate/phosphite/phosphonate ABC transporter substrate-binding protein [Betaproteobacteria bacterium]|nr:phosphate/phosphite/phosphonate ABC transporter substrate-binding protein [Betaproteobacteria bacterium]
MKTLRLWLFGFCLSVGGLAMAAETAPLKLGLLPTLSPRTLLANYQPLRLYLERELKRPVELATAVDFKAFHQATMAGDYDLVLTAPHLARLAQIEGKFKPVATYAATNRAVLIMAKDRPLRAASDVRGKCVAVFDEHALVVMQGLRWLAQRGVKPNLDFRMLETRSHNSVAHSVQSGECVLGITAPGGVKQWSDESREKLAVFTELEEQQAVTWIAHPRLGNKSIERLRGVLLAFGESPEGGPFFANTGYQGMRAVSERDMRKMDVYAKEVGALLRGTP